MAIHENHVIDLRLATAATSTARQQPGSGPDLAHTWLLEAPLLVTKYPSAAATTGREWSRPISRPFGCGNCVSSSVLPTKFRRPSGFLAGQTVAQKRRPSGAHKSAGNFLHLHLPNPQWSP